MGRGGVLGSSAVHPVYVSTLVRRGEAQFDGSTRMVLLLSAPPPPPLTSQQPTSEDETVLE
jgi:hypothetical protein